MCLLITLALEGVERSCAEPDGNRSGQGLQEQSLSLISGKKAVAAPPAAGVPRSRPAGTSPPARLLPPGNIKGWRVPSDAPEDRAEGLFPRAFRPPHGCPASWYHWPPPSTGGGHAVRLTGRGSIPGWLQVSEGGSAGIPSLLAHTLRRGMRGRRSTVCLPLRERLHGGARLVGGG